MFRRMFDQYPEMYLGFQDFLTEHAPHFRRGLRNNAGLMDELLSLVDPAPSDLETRLLTADDENNVQQVNTQVSCLTLAFLTMTDLTARWPWIHTTASYGSLSPY